MISASFWEPPAPKVTHLSVVALRKPWFTQRIGKRRNPGVFCCKTVLRIALQAQQVSPTAMHRKRHDLSHSALASSLCLLCRRAA
jgi:hypothetical protein